MLQFLLRVKRAALFVPMGFGKTAVVLWLIDALLMAGLVNKVLILAPLRVARSTWPDEVRAWSNFSHLRVSPILGSADQRRAALARDAEVFTCNYENLVWLVETLGDDWPFDMVICDEFTRVKGFRSRQGTKRAQALSKVIHTKVTRFVGLTGTPAPNGLLDLWAQAWFLDQGLRLGRTYSAFVNRWFRALPNGGNPQWTRLEAMPHAQAEIQDKLRDVCLTLTVKDWFDVAEPIVNVLRIDLPPTARKHYREMERDLFTQLEGHEIEAFSAAAKSMKLLQQANGAAYVGESNTEWVVTHDEKIEALRSVIEEAAGMPVLVAYHFRSGLARLREAFPAAKVLDNDPKTIEAWNAGMIPILLAHPASAGHGLSLQHGGNILAFFSLNWNLEEHLQVIERIGPVRQKQSGYDRPVFIHYIVARNTIDETVLERLRSKRDVQSVLLDALNRYRETEGELA
jgi:SNF2 family DNA or RNA helicase